MGLITQDDRDSFNGPRHTVGRDPQDAARRRQMNAFVFWPSGDRQRQSRVFAEKVVPAVRESLARQPPRT